MWQTIAVAAGGALFMGVVGGLSTPLGNWYRDLKKPTWQPPNWLFGPAWTLLLVLAATAAVLAWNAAPYAGAKRDVLILFGVNAVFFLGWSPLFFVARRPDWALIEVVFLWASLVALVSGLWPIRPLAAWLIVPYLAWVSFAAFLNWTIVKLNPPFGAHPKSA